MKKFLFFLAACAVSLSTFAAITPAKSTLDFGTVSIKGQSYAEGELKLNVSWTGLMQYAHLFVEFQNEPAEGCAFMVDTDDLITEGSGHPKITEYEYTVSFLADQAGSYTCKMRIYGTNGTTYDYDEAFVDLKVVVTDEAIAGKVYPCTRVTSLSDGDVIVFVNEDAQKVAGPHNSTFLPEVSDNVTIDATHGTATITEDAGFFTVGKSGSNWTFTSSDSKLLGGDGKALKLGEGTTLWTVTFDENDAIVMPKSSSYPMQYNAGDARFKLYNDGSYASVQIYKKSGGAIEVTSKLEITPSAINFGDLACSATKSVEINYTAENLEKDIKWQLTGTDKDQFQLTVTAGNTRENGSVKVKYLGNSTKTGALDAALYYGTWDAKKDTMYASFPLGINLIKLDGIAFKRSSYNALINTSLDLSQELTFDPSTVPSAGRQVTWKIENTYYGSGSITDAGVFSATSSNTYKVIATSTIGDNITASCDIVVSLPAAESITLSKTDTTMHKGDYFTLGATVNPDGAAQAVTYSSDNTTVATFNSSGKITAKGYGNATITVTANSDANIKATCTVHVVPWAVESVEFDPDVITVYTGTRVKLEPTILPAKAIDENDVIFESDDNNTAPVVDSCYVRGDQVGSATITVTAGTLTATLQVNVVNPPYFIKVTTPAILQEKDTIILAADLGGGSTVIAGARDNKKLTVITDGLVDDPNAYAVDAQKFVIGTISGKTGYTLARPGASTVFAEKSNDLYEENKTSTKNLMWEFVADGTNGVYVHNLGNTNAYFKYLASQSSIKPYKSNTDGAVYVYVYRRPYIDPASAVENIEVEAVPAQKLLHEGRIVIIREGVMYELDGRRTK